MRPSLSYTLIILFILAIVECMDRRETATASATKTFTGNERGRQERLEKSIPIKKTKVAYILFKIQDLSRVQEWETLKDPVARRKVTHLKGNMIAFMRRMTIPEYECDDTTQLLNDVRGLALLEDCAFHAGKVVLTDENNLMLLCPATPDAAVHIGDGKTKVIPYQEMLWPLEDLLIFERAKRIFDKLLKKETMSEFTSRITKFAEEKGVLATLSVESQAYAPTSNRRAVIRQMLRDILMSIDPRIPLLSDTQLVDEMLKIIEFVNKGRPEPSGLISRISTELEMFLKSCPRDQDGVYDQVSYNRLCHAEVDSIATSRDWGSDGDKTFLSTM